MFLHLPDTSSRLTFYFLPMLRFVFLFLITTFALCCFSLFVYSIPPTDTGVFVVVCAITYCKIESVFCVVFCVPAAYLLSNLFLFLRLYGMSPD